MYSKTFLKELAETLDIPSSGRLIFTLDVKNIFEGNLYMMMGPVLLMMSHIW